MTVGCFLFDHRILPNFSRELISINEVYLVKIHKNMTEERSTFDKVYATKIPQMLTIRRTSNLIYVSKILYLNNVARVFGNME